MRRFKCLKFLAVGLSVLMISGCGRDAGQGLSGTGADRGAVQAGSGADTAEDLYGQAAASGHVVEFTESGCTVSPSVTEESGGGQICYEAAPGMEEDESNITVTYREDCVFQRVVIYPGTGEMSVSGAELADVKKQSSLLIFGEIQDGKNILAEKIMITRYEGASE